MPELPEVETVRRNLASSVVGTTIVDVVAGEFTGSIAGQAPEEFRRAATGRRINGVGRRAKYLLIYLDTGDAIAVHLRMTGELSLARPEEPSNKHLHLRFVLDDGRELRFTDTRKFGRVRFLSSQALAELSDSLGPEPFDPAFTTEQLHARLQSRSRAIKPLLLDQAFIAGVGNIYADEALFTAGIHPLRPARSLSIDEAGALLAALRDVMEGAIHRGGTTIRDYRGAFGQPGTNQHHLRIYGLAAGDHCPRCGTPIVKTVVAQRGTRFCPSCQPAP